MFFLVILLIMKKVQVLEGIPFDWKMDKVRKALRMDRIKISSDEIFEILNTAKAKIQIRIGYIPVFITHKNHDRVKIEKVTFTSRILRKNLDKVERVFPFILTIGGDLEKEATSSSDLLRQYYLEVLGDIALDEGQEYLEKHLKKRFGLKKLSYMSPGSLKDWPIEEQSMLFSLFYKSEESIGVRLTSTMLMIPKKSISGIYFPTEVSFLSCQLCDRDRCPERGAPYDQDLEKKYLDPDLDTILE